MIIFYFSQNWRLYFDTVNMRGGRNFSSRGSGGPRGGGRGGGYRGNNSSNNSSYRERSSTRYESQHNGRSSYGGGSSDNHYSSSSSGGRARYQGSSRTSNEAKRSYNDVSKASLWPSLPPNNSYNWVFFFLVFSLTLGIVTLPAGSARAMR